MAPGDRLDALANEDLAERYRRLGGRIRERRLAKGLTQKEVMEASGVHTVHVSRLESGQLDPRLSTLLRIAAVLEMPPGELLDG